MTAAEPPAPRISRASAWVVAGVVRNHRLPGDHHRSKQSFEVGELHALGRIGLVERAGGFVPCDVGDGEGLEIGLPLRIAQDLADEAVLAVGQAQNVLEQSIEGLPAVFLHNELQLRPGNGL